MNWKSLKSLIVELLKDRRVQYGIGTTLAVGGGLYLLVGKSGYGKGMWLWRFDYCPEKKDWNAYVDTAKWAGLGHVVGPKLSEGTSWNNNPADCAAFVKSMKGAGIKVLPWHYMWMGNQNSPEIEADSFAQKVDGLGTKVDGVVINAENIGLPGSGKSPRTLSAWSDIGLGKQAASWYAECAIRFTSRLRNNLGSMPIGISTYARVDKHPTFPYEQFFANGADIFMPQSYWCSDQIQLGTTTRGVRWWTTDAQQLFESKIASSTGVRFLPSPPGYLKKSNGWGSCRERGNYATITEYFNLYDEGTIWEWGAINRAGTPHGERDGKASSEIWTALRDSR